jgi:hypothetical protein
MYHAIMEAGIVKWFGAVAIALVCTMAFVIVRKHGLRSELSLSQHVGLSEETFLQFAIFGTVANVLFFVFVAEWMIPHFGLSKLFYYTFLVGMVCQLVSGWTRSNGDNLPSRIHDGFAYTMAFFMPLLLLQLLFVGGLSVVGWAIVFLAFVVEATLITMFFVRRSIRKQYFNSQAVYIALFYAAMLGAAYL